MSIWLVLAIMGCAVSAVRARRLVNAALWLMATSTLVSVMLATLDAPMVAIVELSVGTGLVAVLFVFAIGIAGEEGLHARPVVPTPLAIGLVVPAALLLLWLTSPAAPSSAHAPLTETTVRPLGDLLWNDRAADLIGQAALVVVAALTVRTMLGNDRTAPGSDRRARIVEPTTSTSPGIAPARDHVVVPDSGASGATVPVAVTGAREEVSV